MGLRRFAIREGWTTIVLVAAVVYISVWSILRANWADGLGILNPIAFAGLACGCAVSKWRQAPRLVAHLAALLVGIIVVTYEMTNYLNDQIGSRADKLQWLRGRWHRWA